MEGKVLFALLAVVACATAASISGLASLDPSQMSVGGQIKFPKIPGINAPLFGGGQKPSTGSTVNLPAGTGTNPGSSNSGSRFGPFGQFLNLIPGLNHFLPSEKSSLPSIPNINDLLANIPGFGRNGTNNGNSGLVVPSLPKLPSISNLPYIPGLSEAIGEARQHLKAALNITADISTGIRDAIQVALDSDHPAESITVIMNTIARVYGTVAANCPLVLVGGRVMAEGVRLAGEVVKSIRNVAVGSDNNVF